MLVLANKEVVPHLLLEMNTGY